MTNDLNTGVTRNSQSLLTATVVAVAVIGGLYWAQAVFIPFSIAIFLAFLLSPIVKKLQGWGLGRVPAVTIVLLCATFLVGALVGSVAREMTTVIAGLPDYTSNIRKKVRALRELSERPAKRFEEFIDAISAELQLPGADRQPTTDEASGSTRPRTDGLDYRSWLPKVSYLSSAAEAITSIVIILVLVLFMLLNREDLRDRFIWFMGHGRLSFTTKIVDEATQRISRYLIAQAILNTAFAAAVTISLAVMGVQYALLWGILTGLLRYVPYIGVWIGAFFPIALSLAVSEGWWQPLAIFGLYIILEIITANLVEPWLFGQSAGLSKLAVLVAAIFWTFLWGAVGLVLSTPLTVCLVVLGKYSSQFRFFNVLLSDDPGLDPVVTFYQRLLARDQDEAAEIALTHTGSRPDSVYDELLIPALSNARRDRARDDISADDESFCQQAVREILEDIGESSGVSTPNEAEADDASTASQAVYVLAAPARSTSDRLALDMLHQLLDRNRWHMEVANEDTLVAELIARVAQKRPGVIVIGSLPPGGLSHTRYLCKRLRAACPDVRIIVGRWTASTSGESHDQLKKAGADAVSTSLLATRDQLNVWRPVLAHELQIQTNGEPAEGRRLTGAVAPAAK